MEKIKVYIDFEEISSPFNWDLKIKKTLPFAYTIGIDVNGTFKTKTRIVDFKKIKIKHLNNFFVKSISSDIRKLSNKPRLMISNETIIFAGFGCNLEKRVIKNLFRNIKVIDINNSKEISLTRVTKREMGDKQYFRFLKLATKKHLDREFIDRRGLKKEGALAALAGYLLYLNANKNFNQKYKYEVKMDPNKLLEEIQEYSKDDILRMKIIVDNYPLFYEKFKKHRQLLDNLKKQNRELWIQKIVMKEIENLDPNLTIDSFKNKLLKKIKKLEAQIEENMNVSKNGVL